MSQTPEDRIRRQHRAQKGGYYREEIPQTRLLLMLARQWKRPIREIKAIVSSKTIETFAVGDVVDFEFTGGRDRETDDPLEDFSDVGVVEIHTSRGVMIRYTRDDTVWIPARSWSCIHRRGTSERRPE